jgi:hypothetical protein
MLRPREISTQNFVTHIAMGSNSTLAWKASPNAHTAADLHVRLDP